MLPCWYWDRKDIENSPSRQQGLSAENEARYRKEGAKFIHKLGLELKLHHDTLGNSSFLFSVVHFLNSSDSCCLLPSILPTTLVRQVPPALCYCHLLPLSSWKGRRNAEEMQGSCTTGETASIRAAFRQFWWLGAKCGSNGQGGSDGHGKSFATGD